MSKGKEKNSDLQGGEAPDLYETRLAKLHTLLEKGQNPYMESFSPGHQSADLLNLDESRWNEKFSLAGRLRSRRMMGKAGFMDLEDAKGRIQLYGARDDLNEQFQLLKMLDLGDIIGVEGSLFRTRTGQVTVKVTSLRLLAKCIRPLPVVKEAEGKVFDAFSDKEQRYRMRYVDLIVNPDVRETFITRSKIISYIRSYLIDRGFLEVETPMMHTIPGGATARPFETHHNALNIDLFLRIAPELYLKRLIVGGFPKVFELNRNFRNEGISYKHNPEFTMLELYEAYGDMHSMLQICEELISGAAREVCGTLKIDYEGTSIDLTPPWKRMKYLEAVEEYSNISIHPESDLNEIKVQAEKSGISADDLNDCGSVYQVAELLFDEKVEPNLIQPIFITHFPAEISPLAKRSVESPEFVDRFEPYIAGREMANAFSELNDPIDQKSRFENQVKLREEGKGEGGYMDHDYIRALEYGMPPAGGMGIGIDRLVMLLTNSHSIKDTILFPLLRPEQL